VCYFGLVLALGLLPFVLPASYLTALAVVESLCFLGLGTFILRAAKQHDAQLAA